MKTILLTIFILCAHAVMTQIVLARSFGVSSSLGQSNDPADLLPFSPAGNLAVDLALPVQNGRSAWSFGLESGLYAYNGKPYLYSDTIISQRTERHVSSNLSIKRISCIYSWKRFGFYFPVGFYAGVLWRSTNTWTNKDAATGILISESTNRYSNVFVAGLSFSLEFMVETRRGNYWYIGPYGYFRTNDLFSSFDEEFVGLNGGFRWKFKNE